MNPKEVVEHYGNPTRAAAAIGVTEQSIRNWVKSGEIPNLVQLALQTLTKGKLKADNND